MEQTSTQQALVILIARGRHPSSAQRLVGICRGGAVTHSSGRDEAARVEPGSPDHQGKTLSGGPMDLGGGPTPGDPGSKNLCSSRLTDTDRAR